MNKTEVFISWSGESSRLVARALANWLPDTLQSIECWMSDVDIGAGAQWSSELKAHLDTCSFGILCLTPDNLDSRWMLFEAGYLAKSISGSQIVPYLFNLKPTDVTYPLAQFQAAETTKDGTLKLITSLNAASQQPMSDERVARLLDHWWSDLDQRIGAIPMPDREVARATVTSADRDDRALIEELLLLVRNLQSQPPTTQPQPAHSAPTAALTSSAGRVLLRTWLMRTPTHGHGDDITKVNIPWEFPASEGLDSEPKWPPMLKAEELRMLRVDELENYARILDEAEGVSAHEGFDTHIRHLKELLSDERVRRRKP